MLLWCLAQAMPAALKAALTWPEVSGASRTRTPVASNRAFATAAAIGVPVETVRAVNSHPFESIIATAQERGCDLIFMASHGRRGVTGLILGSETAKVLTHSKIPVLVYR